MRTYQEKRNRVIVCYLERLMNGFGTFRFKVVINFFQSIEQYFSDVN